MYDKLKLYKSQHQILWNIEQLKLISAALEHKIEEDSDNIKLYKQFFLLTKKINEWAKRFYN